MIREYQYKDHPGIVNICKNIWDGNDYLPDIINTLKDDPTCYPLVLIERGIVVSVVNLRKFRKDIAWSEAMRTHPGYRSKGFAYKLFQYQLKLAEDLGFQEIWLSTAATNEATRRMLEKSGFDEKSLFYLKNFEDYEFSSNTTGVEKIDILKANDIITTLEFPYLFGAFKVFPLECDFTQNYKEHLYAIQDRTLLTIKESPERKSDLILGFNGHQADLMEALTFAGSFAYKTIKLFTPPSIELSDPKVFRFMTYKFDQN